jgi:hypothetical protein
MATPARLRRFGGFIDRQGRRKSRRVRVRPAQPYAMTRAYERVWISGALHLRPEEKAVFVVDGQMGVRSAYASDGAAVVAAQSAASPQ